MELFEEEFNTNFMSDLSQAIYYNLTNEKENIVHNSILKSFNRTWSMLTDKNCIDFNLELFYNNTEEVNKIMSYSDFENKAKNIVAEKTYNEANRIAKQINKSLY